MESLTTRINLNNGTAIPMFGYGTYKIKDPNEAYNSVRLALKTAIAILTPLLFMKMKSTLLMQSRIL